MSLSCLFAGVAQWNVSSVKVVVRPLLHTNINMALNYLVGRNNLQTKRYHLT